MKNTFSLKVCCFLLLSFFIFNSVRSQIIISQYYEGTGTNKWIELTNLGNTSVNTASPQLQLGLWAVAGSTGNITFTGLPTNTVNLTVTIPAKGSVLIGNTANGTEIPYLTAASAAQTSNSVINFNGNDGIALLNASGTILDKFGEGINATDISYARKVTVTAQSATFFLSDWNSASIATVQTAASTDPNRLGFHLPAICTTPPAQPTALVFGTTNDTSIAGSFTAAAGADEYLVVRSTVSSLSANPVNGTTYNSGNALGGGIVVSRGSSTSFNATGLTAGTTYYFFIFSIKSAACSSGPVYLTTSPLTGNKTTTSGILNFYYGNLHAHSAYSDGNKEDTTKTPANDYAFAKTSLCLDFLGISEHNHTGAGMHLYRWAPGITQAAAATTSNFIAMHGMEWGVISGGGHVIVYGVDSLIGWEAGEYQIFVPQSVYTGSGGLFDIINRHGNNAFAYLAHPENTDYNNLSTVAYDQQADNAIVGTAVESGPAFSTDTTYTNPPASLAFYSYYKKLLAKGYYVGPTMDHDNHYLTFGHTAKTRLVVLAPSLSEANIMSAMRQMRFYASEDCGAKISYTVNTQPMGSILRKAGAPVFSVGSITTSAVTSLKLMYGVPGSGVLPAQLTSSLNGTLSYTDNALTNLSTRYYYLDITEADGTRILTSPVWYTRDDAARLATPVTSFYTVNEADKVMLKWSTANELDHQLFEIERSVDGGRSYYKIETLAGEGRDRMNYAVTDEHPVDGLTYYRLVQKNAEGLTNFSDTKVVNRGRSSAAYFTAYPNPVQDVLNVKIMAALSQNTSIELYDITGRKQKVQQLSLHPGEQDIQVDMSKLVKGTYTLKLMIGNRVMTQLINKF